MNDLVTYIFGEVKERRLDKKNAIDLIRQFQGYTNKNKASVLHPLLHENVSGLDGQQFSSVFSGEEYFLRDHKVQAEKVLPGVAHLEMACKAGALSSQQEVVEIRDVVWSKPIRVNGAALEVQIGLYPTADAIAYEIVTDAPETPEQRTLHSQGKLLLGTRSEREQPERLDIEAIAARCPDMQEASYCYEVFKTQGLDYGDSFQGLKRIRYNSNEALAELELPSNLLSGKETYDLHPSLLDAALQSTLGLSLTQGGETGPGPHIPFSVKQIQVYSQATACVYAYVRYSAEMKRDGKVLKYDIDLLDSAGNIAIALKEFTALPVVEPKIESTKNILYSTTTWVEMALDQSQANAQQTEVKDELLLVLADGSIMSELSEQLLPESSLVLPDATATDTTFADWVQSNFIAVFDVLQKRMQAKPKIKQTVLVLIPITTNEYAHASLLGLLRSVQMENPLFQGKLIYYKQDIPVRSLSQRVVSERKTMANSVEVVRYLSLEQREVQALTEADLSNAYEVPAKAGGVYWITGGLGGLGLLFAKYLGAADGTKIILTGRSELSADKQAALDTLCATGVTAEYLKSDISNRTDVEKTFDKIKRLHGRLDGIIHSAGMIRDSFILKKTRKEIAAVFAPKVAGLINLDKACQSEPLDFLVAFSSLSGALGNVGQADYAGANAFMDAYILYRQELVASGQRSGKSLSLNWPLWRAGGMQVDEQSEALLLQHGMVPLSESQGLQAFSAALKSAHTQVLVFAGHLQKLRSRLFPKTKVTLSSAKGDSSSEQFSVITEKVSQELLNMVAELLKMKIEDIDLESDINEYGFDSISYTALANKINQVYGLELMPTVFYEHPSLAHFSEYIVNNHLDELQAKFKLSPEKSNSSEKVSNPQNAELKSTARPKLFFEKRLEPVPSNSEITTAEPVAIIGISGQMPGAPDLATFWHNLVNNVDSVSEVSETRWDWRAHWGDPLRDRNKTNIKWGGFIEDVDKFDPLFFNISPLEAELMDPQQRLFMQTVWSAIEDAGYRTGDFSGTETGLFVGVANTDYAELMERADVEISAQSSTGISHAMLANRISYLLNIHGPSEPIDTACSSSLIAIHRAIQAIKCGDIEMAIAGGVNVLLSPTATISFNKAGMLCEDGRCKTFDKRANGYVRGEGVGAVVLKKLSKAIADNDHIYAVVKGTSENHGGQANSLTAPNPQAQRKLLVDAYTKSGIDPRTVSYIEAHGTGTELGDPIEINALKSAFEELYKQRELQIDSAHCAIGSVKTNIGHLETAAGIAGILKVLLALKYNKLPGNVHLTEKNPYIQLDGSPFYLIKDTQDWQRLTDANNQPIPRRAGVSSFGFGGANSHVIIEEYISEQKPHIQDTSPQLIVLSAKTQDRLRVYAQQLKHFVDKRLHNEYSDLIETAYTLQIGRDAMEYRLAVVVDSMEELAEVLARYCAGEHDIEGIHAGRIEQDKDLVRFLGRDEDSNQMIKSWIEKGKLRKLAGLWVKGLEVDWQLLYENDPPQRISLPTYPFAKERYWVTGTAGMSNNSIGQRRLHPLLHENVSDLDGQQFSSVFSGEEYFLRDHKVQAEKVLPGAAHLEMACKAGALSSQQEVVEIRDVVWSKPIRVNGAALEVQIGLYPTADAIAYEIVTDAPETPEQRILHSQGKILLGARSEREQPERLDIEAIAARCPDMQEASYCYEVFKTQGLEYGDSFQGLKRIRYNSNEALAELELPSNLLSGKETYDLHPSLLDAALQSTLGLSLTQGGETGPGPHIPFSVKQIQVYSQATACVYAYVRYSAEMKRDGKVLKYDIDLMDSAGNIAIALKEFTALPVVEADSIVRQDNTPAEQGEGVKPSVAQAAIMSQSDDNRDNPTPNVEEELKRRANDYFRSVLAKLLKIDIKRVDANAALEKYGIDSIMIVSLTTELEKQFGVLSKTLFFEYQTLAELTDYFLDTHREQLLSLINAVSPSLGTKEAVASSAVHTTAEPPSSDITTTKPPTVKRRRFNQQLPSQPGKPSDAEAADEAIAIIGVSGRYPKAPNLQAFWDNLTQGRDCIEEIPADRWDHSQYYDADKDKAGKTYGKWGGFIDDVDKFDPMFFNISPREAEIMDPQERLFLETVWETLEDAGYTRESLNKTQDSKTGLAGEVGVYVGVMYEEYQLYGAEQSQQGNVMALSGNPASIANRVSYYCNFHGPSMALDTMCSSSLTAIHLACEAIKSGSCQAAIAGGVNVSIHPNKYIALGQGKFISSKGRCESFGEGGEGYVPGEGVGAVLLKPLSQARADGDQIYAVVKGTTLNHGGKTNGYTVPNPQAQSAVIEKTLATAKVDPRAISYIEAHGTGTSLGDPIEIRGLAKAFSAYTQDKQYCAIGSVKSNIGHCESAAGIAGVTKVLLQMKHKQLVPSLHSQHLNPNIDFSETPFKVQQTLQEWLPPEINEDGDVHKYPRIAGVSSFGAGGSNAHVLLEEYCSEASEDSAAQAGPVIVPLSAKNSDRLKEYAKRLLSFVTANDQIVLADLAYTMQVGREAMEQRLALVTGSLAELTAQLELYIDGDTENLVNYTGRAVKSTDLSTEKLSTIDSYLNNKDYVKLAQAWVEGADLNWSMLYQDTKPHRLSLPVYPFAKKRYWFDSYQKNSVTKSQLSVDSMNIVDKAIVNTPAMVTQSIWETDTPSESQPYAGIEEVKLKVIDDAIAIVSMEDREHRNMFSNRLIQGLHSCLLEVRRNENIKVVILTGYENIFCMGGTEENLLDIAEQRANFTDIPFLYRGLLEFDVPVISAIQGHAFGGGLLFGLYGDIVLMAEEGVYAANFMKYGFTPGMGATYILGEKLGKNLAVEMMYTGKTFEGTLLKQRGASVLMSKSDQVMDEALKIAYQFVKKPRQALQLLKKELSGRILNELLASIDSEVKMHAETFSTDSVKNNIKHHFEKVGKQNSSINGTTSAMHHRGKLSLRSPQLHIETDTSVSERTAFNGGSAKSKVRLRQLLSEQLTHNEPANHEPSKQVSAVKLDEDQTRENVISLRHNLAETSGGKKQADIQLKLVSIFKGMLHLDESDIDVGVSFQELGLDSISGVEIVRDINQVFGTELDVSALYDHHSVTALAQLIFGQLSGPVSQSISSTIKESATNEQQVADFSMHEEDKLPGQPVDFPHVGSVQNRHLSETKVIHAKLIEIIIGVIHLDVEDLGAEETFQDLGIDSISGVEILRDINKGFNIELETTVLYDHYNLDLLAEYISKKIGAQSTELSQVNYDSKNAAHTVTEGKHADVKSPTEIAEGVESTKLADVSFKRKAVTDNPAVSTNQSADIAVIGISGQFPAAKDTTEFWNNLAAGVNSVNKAPAGRWHSNGQLNEVANANCQWAGFLEDVEYFDPLFFNISPYEAEAMDPQQRLFLQESWRALEDSGYTTDTLRNTECGVFVGASQGDYGLRNSDLSAHNLTGNISSMLASRIAYFMDLRGACMTIDTACSSSLSAIHLASESLRNGECEVALAGGVHIMTTPNVPLMLNKIGILSSTGRSKTFDASADGWVVGETVGVVILKPLIKAIIDRDAIYAVIKSSGYNQSGKTNGVGAPKSAAQSDLQKKVYQKASIDPETIDYIEVQGASDRIGDAIEISALKNSFSSQTDRRNFCALGSLKPNIGHPLAASGIACFIKVLLALKHKQIPPTINVETVNESLALEESPFYINTELADWPTKKTSPRRAAVNNYGFSGTNCHLVLEEYIEPEIDGNNVVDISPQLIVFSAKKDKILKDVANNFKNYLLDNSTLSACDLKNIAYTLLVGRQAMECRVAFIVNNPRELLDKLARFCAGSTDIEHCYQGDNLKTRDHEKITQPYMHDDEIGLLSAVGQRWVNGLDIDEISIFNGQKPARVHLPTYLFEKRRCWIDAKNSVVTDITTAKIKSDRHSAAKPALVQRDKIIAITSEALGLNPDEIDYNESLEQYGLDSILTIKILQSLQTQVSPAFNLESLRSCNTLQDIIDALPAQFENPLSPAIPMPIENSLNTSWPQFPELIHMNKSFQGTPIFWFHGGLGGVELYQSIAEKIQRPFFGIQARGWMTDRAPLPGVQAMAAYYVNIIQSVYPDGSYDLGGYSLGGILAYEVTRQLQELHQSVNSIVMLDSLDSIVFKNIDLSYRSKLLQAANVLLSTSKTYSLNELREILIHNDQVNTTIEDDGDFITHLTDLMNQRGIKKSTEQLQAKIQQTAKVLHSYEGQVYEVLPLSKPESVDCYYFRNKNGIFLGDLEPYYSLPGDSISLDKKIYWSEWERNITQFHVTEVDVENHLMFLNDINVATQIIEFCMDLYCGDSESENTEKPFREMI